MRKFNGSMTFIVYVINENNPAEDSSHKMQGLPFIFTQSAKLPNLDCTLGTIN
jgi:hypothetical protein